MTGVGAVRGVTSDVSPAVGEAGHRLRRLFLIPPLRLPFVGRRRSRAEANALRANDRGRLAPPKDRFLDVIVLLSVVLFVLLGAGVGVLAIQMSLH